MARQGRKFVFTINNYTEEDVERIKSTNCIACVCSREVGAEGTPHLQGAIIFADSKSFTAVQKRLRPPGSPGCFTAVMRGDWDKQLSYCGKGEQSHAEWALDGRNGAHYGLNAELIRQDPYIEQQGARNDLVPFRDAILAGDSDLELVMAMPEMVARFPRFVNTVRAAAAEEVAVALPTGSKKMGAWIWARDGDEGKTGWVDRRHPGRYEKPSNKWWDGYAGEKVVLIDDPTPAWAPHLMGYVKQWVQEKPFIGEIKGGARSIRFEQIYICANFPPDEYFGAAFQAGPFDRRFVTVKVGKLYLEDGSERPSYVLSL